MTATTATQTESPVPGMSAEAFQAWTDKLYPPAPSAADLAAFADAVQDYAATYEAEDEASRPRLLLEGAELFRATLGRVA